MGTITESPARIKQISPDLFRVRLTKYIPIEPTSTQYAALLLNDFLEAFYGGSGGGGKSIYLLTAGLQYVDQPDYNAILFRKTYKQLTMPGGLLDEAMKWLKPYPEVKFNSETKMFTFPEGARLKFGHLESENDKFNYQSTEFHYIGIDELTDFTVSQYLFLFSRLRKKVYCNIPLRMRSASNPVGQGFEWVKNRFVVNGQNNRIPFIPASLKDNPHIDRESYIRSLDNLDPVTREKILNGDWSIREESVMFKPQWFKVVSSQPDAVANAVRVWDMAATAEKENPKSSYTAGVLMVRLYDKTFCIPDIIRFRGTPKEVEETVRNTAIRDGKSVDIHIEQEGGSSGKSLIDHYARNVLLGWTVKPVSPSGSKVARASPMASYMERGYVSFVSSALRPEILDEFIMFPVGKYSDCVDAASHGFNILATKPMPTGGMIYRDIYRQEKTFLKWG